MLSKRRLKRRFREFTRRLGFEVTPYPGGKERWQQLLDMMALRRIDTVLDVGANTGQYATALRCAGFDGRIISFEPLTQAHAQLTAAASGDARWVIAPRMAIGAAHGETTINVSAESDMSSILPMRADTEQKLASSRYVSQEVTPVRTLAELWDEYAGDNRIFIKIDTQGYEDKVLDGLGARIKAVSGMQLELALTPLYEGETLYNGILDRLGRNGLTAHLVIPGYYSRHHQRMLQFDAVLFRELA